MLSRTRQIFIRYVHMTYGLNADKLCAIVNDSKHYSPVMRAAALRNMIGLAPISVTGGQPFAARRRAVRSHYNL